MDERVAKYLEDVLNACKEVETFFEGQPKLFDDFKDNMLKRRAVERNVEIMGEAINKMMKIDPDLQLANARAIVDTRNRVIHSYDNVTPEFLWSLVVRHIPQLKTDVEQLMKS